MCGINGQSREVQGQNLNIFLEKIPELNKTIVLKVHQTLSLSEKEGFDIV